MKVLTRERYVSLPPPAHDGRVALERAAGDRREPLAQAALQQTWIAHAPAILVVTAVPERTTFTYGERGRRYVQQEAGAAAQNLQLQAAALGLASAVVGAFRDDELARLIALPAWEEPVCILPVGWPSEKRGLSC